MRLRISAAFALLKFAALSASANPEAASALADPESAAGGASSTESAAPRDNKSNVPPSTTYTDDTGRRLKKRGKAAKSSKGKAAKGGDGRSAKTDDGGQMRNSKLLECAEKLVGEHIYGGSCGKTFVVTIGCRDEHHFEDCVYSEVS
ncbi:hypothetical protein THAOC_18037, partial [Thalassiosira oceanica]